MWKSILIISLYFNFAFSYIRVYEGSNIKLYCPFPKGTPNLSWNRQFGIPVIFLTFKSNSGKLETVRTDKHSFPRFGLQSETILTISNIQPEDSNIYYCAVDGVKFFTEVVVEKRTIISTTASTASKPTTPDKVIGLILLTLICILILFILLSITFCHINRHKYGLPIYDI